jgi:hypothetical protein
MWNKPIEKRLAKIPQLYTTQNTLAKDKIIHLHFFIGGCDWYVAEYDGKDTFYGFVVLNGDKQNAGWGNFSFSELCTIKKGFVEIDCEKAIYFKPSAVQQIYYIRGIA